MTVIRLLGIAATTEWVVASGDNSPSRFEDDAIRGPLVVPVLLDHEPNKRVGECLVTWSRERRLWVAMLEIEPQHGLELDTRPGISVSYITILSKNLPQGLSYSLVALEHAALVTAPTDDNCRWLRMPDKATL